MVRHWHRGWGVSLWLPAAVALTFLVFLKLDPFGLHSASEARSQQATLRVVSPFYSPSRQVVVVLIDDDYLRERQIGWPLRYAEQGRLLRQLSSVDPAVVLVDLIYPHSHSAGLPGGAPDDIAQLIRPILWATCRSSSPRSRRNRARCRRTLPIAVTEAARPRSTCWTRSHCRRR